MLFSEHSFKISDLHPVKLNAVTVSHETHSMDQLQILLAVCNAADVIGSIGLPEVLHDRKLFFKN